MEPIRLEFSAAGSHKFWQIFREGTRVVTEWGRISTAGQSQSQDFVSEEMASAFMEKQAAAKRKKGYQPPASQTAQAPAPQPQPAPAAAAAAVAWTPRLRKSRLGYWIRLWDTEPLPPQTAFPANWQAFQQKIRDRVLPLQWAAAGPASVAGPAARALALAKSEPDSLPLAPCAALLALYSGRELIDYLLARQGLAFALEALVESLHFGVRSWYDKAWQQELQWQEQVPNLEMVIRLQPWLALREYLHTLPSEDPAYEQALPALAALRSRWPLASRIALSFLVWRQRDWVGLDAAEWLALVTESGRDSLPCAGWLLWPVLTQPELLAAMAGRYAGLPKEARQAADTLLRDWVFWMLELVGPEAAASLAALVRHGTLAEVRKSAAEALSLIRTPHGFSLMAGLLDLREGSKYAQPVLLAHPAEAIPALRQALAERPRLAEARSLLEGLLRLYPEAAGQVAHGPPSPPPAAGDDLPEIFRSPPWQAQPGPRRPLSVSLEVLAETETIAWRPADLQRQLQPFIHRKPPIQPSKDAATLAELQAQAGLDKMDLDELDRLTHPAALAFWNSQLQGSPARYPFAAQLKQRNWSRYSLNNADPWYLLCLLQRFGLDGLPGLIACCLEKPVYCFPLLARIVSPRLAFTLAMGLALPAVRTICYDWLCTYPEAAALGLIPAAVGEPGPERQAIEQVLRGLGQDVSWRQRFRAAAQCYGAAAERALDEILEQDACLDTPPLPPLPSFWNPSFFPPPRLQASGQALPAEAIGILGTMLALSTPCWPYAALNQVRKLCTPESLEDFAWSVCERWLADGAAGKWEWALLALGWLGGERTVARLAPLIAKWPGEKAHGRALLGLDVLTEIGSDQALGAIQHLALKARFPALKEAARERLQAIARWRGVPLAALLDSIVPDCGLNPEHTRHFGDLSAGFAGMKAHLLDGQGRKLTKPPQGVAWESQWKSFRKEAEQALVRQSARLEQAMCVSQRWSPGDFQNLLWRHPLVGVLARCLIWGAWDAGGEWVASFLPGDALSLADGSSFEPDPDCRIGVAHPLWLLPELPLWRAELAQKNIQQPFAQLDRPIFHYEPPDLVACPSSRFQYLEVDAKALLGLIRQQGWADRGEGEVERAFPADMKVRLSLEIAPFALADYQTTRIYQIDLLHQQRPVPLGALDPVSFSELARQLEAIRPGNS